MERFSDPLHPDKEMLNALGKLSTQRTASHQHSLHCQNCGQRFYVDQIAYNKVVASLEGEASEISFYCETCEDHDLQEIYRGWLRQML